MKYPSSRHGLRLLQIQLYKNWSGVIASQGLPAGTGPKQTRWQFSSLVDRCLHKYPNILPFLLMVSSIIYVSFLPVLIGFIKASTNFVLRNGKKDKNK